MKYRFLGNSGLEVSEICFGTMTFVGEDGWTNVGSSGQKDANKLVAMAFDAGVNFFDTADIYSNGESERIFGKAIANRRSDVVIATKCGFRMKEGPNEDGLSRRRIIEACDASLRRLGTDYIDLYQVHSYDFLTPLEETLSTLNYLVQQGKVRYLGCSNFTAGQLMKAQLLCRANGWEPLISLQAYYSLMGRDLELDLVPVCQDQGLGVMVWGPLNGGFLSGKYRRNAPWPEGTRLKEATDMRPSDLEKGFAIIDNLVEIAESRQVAIAQVALNYLLRKPSISSLVIGARDSGQLLENLGISDWELSREELDSLDQVSEPAKYYPHWYFDLYRKDRM